MLLENIIIGIDTSSCDPKDEQGNPLDPTDYWIDAGINALQECENLKIMFAGNEWHIIDLLLSKNVDPEMYARIGIVDATFYINADGKYQSYKTHNDGSFSDFRGDIVEPTGNRREKAAFSHDSTLGKLCSLHMAGDIDAVVSGTNTGKLAQDVIMNLVKKLDCYNSIPPLQTIVPNARDFPNSKTVLLDVGITGHNTNCKHMKYFGITGRALAKVDNNVQYPTIGTYLKAFSDDVKEGIGAFFRKLCTYRNMDIKKESIEKKYKHDCTMRDIFSGDVDVLVMDGESGNKALKTLESYFSNLYVNIKERRFKEAGKAILGFPKAFVNPKYAFTEDISLFPHRNGYSILVKAEDDTVEEILQAAERGLVLAQIDSSLPEEIKIGLIAYGEEVDKLPTVKKKGHEALCSLFDPDHIVNEKVIYLGPVEPKGHHGLYTGGTDVYVATPLDYEVLTDTTKSCAQLGRAILKYLGKRAFQKLSFKKAWSEVKEIIDPRNSNFSRIPNLAYTQKADSAGNPMPARVYKVHGSTDKLGMKKALVNIYDGIEDGKVINHTKEIELLCKTYASDLNGN
jgi:fatty acid/phospholipid biosynthesis enzyme